MAPLRDRLANFLVLNRTVGVVLLSVLLFGLGEQLWEAFLPVYLKATGKHGDGRITNDTLWLIGVYALARNLFEAVCYVGGGRITGWLGDRGSMLLFSVLTLAGYALFLTVSAPWAAVLAALLILGWEPLSVPLTFTTVGATVSKEKRGAAFAIQSIQKRLPRMIGPAIAAFVLAAFARRWGRDEGHALGMKWLVAASLLLGLVTLGIQWKWMPHRKNDDQPIAWRRLWAAYPIVLRRLLLAEICTRWCDWLVREFVVLYVLFVRSVSIEAIGFYMVLQHAAALMTYLPIGHLTKSVGLRPFIGLTFVFFALFPLTLVLLPDNLLWIAFIVYGLREIGEPARKALITTNIPEEVRARGVGLYWGLRTIAIASAAPVGAALWIEFGPETLFQVAFGFGVLAVAVFYFLCPAET